MPAGGDLRRIRRACVAVALAVGALGLGTAPTAAAPAPASPPGTVHAQATALAVTSTNSPVIGAATTATGKGYWIATADGHVWAYGDARNLGDLSRKRLVRPIVGIESTKDGKGFWLVASDGGVFAFGTARYYGSTGGKRLNAPILGMERTHTGRGYWLIASDGGIFTFGDARFFGSTGAKRLNAPIVGMTRIRNGNGYWLVARDGGIFTFGDARFRGSLGAMKLSSPVKGMAGGTTRDGYWLFTDDGAIYPFGVPNHDGMWADGHWRDARAVTPTPDDKGYWLVTGRGAVIPFGSAKWYGSVVRPRPKVHGQPTVKFYGDSLVAESAPQLQWNATLAGIKAINRSFPGTVLCDWLNDMARLSEAKPVIAVIAFSGNNFRPCLPPKASSDADALLAGYERAAQQALSILAANGTRVVFALPPPRIDVVGAERLPDHYRSVAQRWPTLARTYDAGRLVADEDREWTDTLPCLPFEGAAQGCTNGKIPVRSKDHVHFCLGSLAKPGNVYSGCNVWSSGSWRYSTGLVEAAKRGLRW